MVRANDQGQQSANVQMMLNNSPKWGWDLETLKLCDYGKQTLFIGPLGAVQLYG